MDINEQILHLDTLVTGFIYRGIDFADGQFSTILLTHPGCTSLVNVYLEITLQAYGSDILHLQHLTQLDRPRLSLAFHVFGILIDGEVKGKTTHCRPQHTLEFLTTVRYMDIAHIADITQGLQLFHQHLLHGELIDNLLLHRTLGRHLVDVEANV